MNANLASASEEEVFLLINEIFGEGTNPGRIRRKRSVCTKKASVEISPDELNRLTFAELCDRLNINRGVARGGDEDHQETTRVLDAAALADADFDFRKTVPTPGVAP